MSKMIKIYRNMMTYHPEITRQTKSKGKSKSPEDHLEERLRESDMVTSPCESRKKRLLAATSTQKHWHRLVNHDKDSSPRK